MPVLQELCQHPDAVPEALGPGMELTTEMPPEQTARGNVAVRGSDVRMLWLSGLLRTVAVKIHGACGCQ